MFRKLRYVGKFARQTHDLSTLRDLSPWLASQGRTALDDAAPWLTYGSVRALRKHVGPGVRVLEYGAGGSTLFFAAAEAAIVTIEHDEEWADRVRHRVGDAVDLRVVPPSLGDDNQYSSTDESYAGMSFRRYASACDDLADESMDILLVDGRARPAAFRHGHSKVRAGGLVILDDSYRPAYAEVFETAHAAGWQELRFPGPQPYGLYFGETTIWTKSTGSR